MLVDYGCPSEKYINGKLTEFTISFDNDSSGITTPNKTIVLSTEFTKDSPMLVIKIPKEHLGADTATMADSSINIRFTLISTLGDSNCEPTLDLNIDFMDHDINSTNIDLSTEGYWHYIDIL